MFAATSFVPAAGAAPVELTLEAGAARTMPGAHPELGRALALLRRPHAGRVIFEGRDLTTLNDGALRQVRRRLQYVGGDPRRALLPNQTLEQVLAEPLRIHKVARPDDQRARLERAAQALRLSAALFDRPVAELSTALRWRALVARALTLSPALLIVDAPADHLARVLLDALHIDLDAARGNTALLWLAPAG